jgi:hypothetical protein
MVIQGDYDEEIVGTGTGQVGWVFTRDGATVAVLVDHVEYEVVNVTVVGAPEVTSCE